jgi:hypothetical protein
VSCLLLRVVISMKKPHVDHITSQRCCLKMNIVRDGNVQLVWLRVCKIYLKIHMLNPLTLVALFRTKVDLWQQYIIKCYV